MSLDTPLDRVMAKAKSENRAALIAYIPAGFPSHEGCKKVIAAFAEMIGVPRTGLANLISGLKDIATNKTPQQQQQQQQQQPVTENKIIKVKDIR